jgi:hypothetical protein
MNRRKTIAAIVIVLVLTLALPVVVGAGRPPSFQPTHLARIEGDFLQAGDQPVQQEKSGAIIHADPTWQSYTLTILEGFFGDCSEPGCPGPGTYPGYLAIYDYDHDGVWRLGLNVKAGDLRYRIEADGVLVQARKGQPFTFTPSTALEVWYPGAPNGVIIGYADRNLTIIGTPID